MQQASDQMAEEYAKEHLRFLEQNRPDVLAQLRRSGDLNKYLSSVGEQASDLFSTLMSQYGNSSEVQKLPYLDRVQALQSRRHEANEIVLHDIVYQPLREY
jgi:Zn-finger domain-containing protein